MSDKANSINDSVAPIGRGQFFTVDRRAWAKVCSLSMNAAVAYLVLARGTLHDMRTTAWSAKSIEERTAIPWRKAKEAVQTLVTSGLVRQDAGGKHPRYYMLPAQEIPGCVPGAKLPALTSEENKLVERLKAGAARVPKAGRWNGTGWGRISTRPHDLAMELVRKGVLLEHGRHFSVVSPPGDDKPDWVWLPVAIVDGAADEIAPIELIRQSANFAALRLFVDLYHAQSLNDHGGVHWRQLRQEYARFEVGSYGSYIVWGFRTENSRGWTSAPFISAHLTGKCERKSRPGGGYEEIDPGWQTFWDALEVLTSTGLVEMVGHVIDADTDEGTVLHPYAMGNGEPGEQAIAQAASSAGWAMLNSAKRQAASDDRLWLLPVRRHIREVQLVGLARLRYRARTKMTAAWMSASEEWDLWAQRYGTAEAEALNISTYADINGTSTAHQR